ncbi:hypothetical protein GCK72_024645 [Caenorhabditis remanei]|uniref:Uncharacterized protein n=1 Tax=Caenorhabditis remanei TaxID=31234 RepID=A0A6A5FZS8_CAERE|nr:hypothetical protein GCK72_024645 [Caenorhabditis remanei]KAF1748178.1 hypothetical protein GCK72_024645 [Caenorhabditis remanei]
MKDCVSLSALGGGESNSLVSVVEDGVEASNEDVSENPEWSSWGWDIHSHESREAGHSSVSVGHLENVVLSLEVEVLSSESEGDVWQLWNLAALNLVLSVEEWDSSDLVLDLLDHISWSSEEGSSGINNRVDWSVSVSGSINADGSELDSPVIHRDEWLPGDVSGVVVGVSVAKGDFSSVGDIIGVTAKPESEELVGADGGVGEDLVHWLGDLVNRDSVPSHSEDSVELGSDEGDSWLRGSAGQSLGLVGTECGVMGELKKIMKLKRKTYENNKQLTQTTSLSTVPFMDPVPY